MANTNSSYKKYEESDAVKRAKENLDRTAAGKPGAYQSQWQTQLNDTMGKIMNREKFSYDLNGDALYRQYKDNAVLQGQQAMMDTMGQAQAMTGGYGNTYAQMAGQQAYQLSLQQLNNVIPELYQLALDKYNREGQALTEQYGLLSDQDSRDYNRHRDTVGDWNTAMDRAQSRYDQERSFDYARFADDRNLSYQQTRDSIADQQHDEKMKLSREQFAWEQIQDTATDPLQYTYAREDDYGNSVYYSGGKEYTFEPWINPYTGSKNPDADNGTFGNGYQPDNVTSYYLPTNPTEEEVKNAKAKGKLTKTGMTDVVNGVVQSVYKTPDGKLWIWDDLQNAYQEYDDGTVDTNKYGTTGKPASDKGARAEIFDPESKNRYLIT